MRAAPENDAPFEVGHRAVFFRPLRRREDDVGELRGLGQEEIGDDEQIERARGVPSTCDPSGTDTAGFDPTTSSARTPPSVPMLSSSS